MPKKKILDDVSEETVIETPEVALPTTPDELSPLVVSFQNEIKGLQAEIAASRADFVKTTDKQFARIKELDAVIASKEADLESYNVLIAQIPELQKQYSDARNKTTQIFADAEKAQKDVERAQIQIAKDAASNAEQKALNDTTSANLSTLAQTLQTRSDELDERDKTLAPLKKALGLK
jgi:chromosome segregation ATPase